MPDDLMFLCSSDLGRSNTKLVWHCWLVILSDNNHRSDNLLAVNNLDIVSSRHQCFCHFSFAVIMGLHSVVEMTHCGSFTVNVVLIDI